MARLSQQQTGRLGQVDGNLIACTRILGQAAAKGTRAKPTVAELNEILSRLDNARIALLGVMVEHDKS